MTFSLDKETMEIACPQCGRKFKETLGRLKNSPTVTCTGCKARIKVDATQLRNALKRVEAGFAKVEQAVKRINKR